MKICGIIQARLGSKRLPKKVLLKLGDKTILEILITRLKKARSLNNLILATTTNKEDDVLVNIAADYNIDVYRGSEYDVLDRVYKAAKEYDANIIVRITADNPLTDIYILDKIVEILLKGHFDYVAPIDLILGLGSEAIAFGALEKTWREARKPYQREHVTPYIYENENLFRIYYYLPPKKFRRKDIRLTIDVWEDYMLFLELYRRLGDLSKVCIDDILKLFDNDPSLKEINRNVKQRPYTHYERRELEKNLSNF